MERLWSRAVATGGTGRKWNRCEGGSNRREPLPWVAIGCRGNAMVKRVDLRPRPTAARARWLDRTIVAHVGTGRASAVRADRRRTVSGEVRREGRFRLSHADSVGRCQVGSGYRVGLQAGGRGFDPGTLHHKKAPLQRFLHCADIHTGNERTRGASAVPSKDGESSHAGGRRFESRRSRL
jgi:hypothetical protein